MKEADDIISPAIAGLSMACRPGCSWCCHQLVVVTCAADGHRILAAAKQRMTKRAFKSFKRTVRQQAKAIAELSHTEAELRCWPCPLLNEDRCVVYDVRPVACRSVFSPDSECCRAMLHAESFDVLPDAYKELATEISDRAMQLQIAVNDRRPIDGAFELRALLVSLMDGNHG